MSTLDLTHAAQGVHTLPDVAAAPDAEGVLTELAIHLPPMEVVSHFAAFQRHDPMGVPQEKESIGGGANRVQGLRIERWGETIEGGIYATILLKDGDWLVLLPITGRETTAWLKPDGDDLALRVGTLGTEPVKADLPVLAWCRHRNLYRACETAWRLALRHPLVRGQARLRQEKLYPTFARYLGWCSWEQYKVRISSELLVGAAKRIHAQDLPIRYFLVDDGYLIASESLSISALGPKSDTFPDGWQPLLEQRRDDGLCWFGLWQNFNGYWKGVSRDNKLGEELNRHLMPVPGGELMPGPDFPDRVAWYEAMVAMPREAGFDFVKVDNQTENLFHYKGTANAVRATAQSNQAFERAAAAQVDGVINCMAHGPVNSFNTALSAITRCSEDYQVNDAWRAKAHLHNSYQNMLWLGPTVWGDHDMFHSSDTFAGRMMAVSKAVSGGPIYLSDDPDDFNPEAVWPLCDQQGKLYRPLAPAVVLPRCATQNPFEQAEPYVAGAPLPNGAAAIVAYNFTEPTQPVAGSVTAEDYVAATGFLEEEREVPEEGLVLYDWYEQTAVLLEDEWAYELPAFEDRLLLLCPIQHGWAVIGRTDKYLSPAALDVVHLTQGEIILRSDEACDVTLWRDGKPQVTAIAAGTTTISRET